MPVYKIAGLKVEYEPKYDMLKQRSEKYLCGEKADYHIGIKEGAVEERLALLNGDATLDAIEYLLMGSAFHLLLLEHEGVFLHSSTVVVDGKAYSFSAPCQTGKSTHTSLWLKKFGDRAFIINDDKAIFRKIDGQYKVFGSPFCGKYDINVDTSAELGGICFIEQAKENSIEKIDSKQALPLFISQTVRPQSAERMILLCDALDDLFKEIPIYKLKCNISLEAAELSYQTMSKGKI